MTRDRPDSSPSDEAEDRLESDGKADALAETLVVRPGVDADQRAMAIVQSATAVAGIDGRLRLDHANIGVAFALLAELRNRALRVGPTQVVRLQSRTPDRPRASVFRLTKGRPGPRPSHTARGRATSTPLGATQTIRAGSGD